MNQSSPTNVTPAQRLGTWALVAADLAHERPDQAERWAAVGYDLWQLADVLDDLVDEEVVARLSAGVERVRAANAELIESPVIVLDGRDSR
jgi:hypothetical protein